MQEFMMMTENVDSGDWQEEDSFTDMWSGKFFSGNFHLNNLHFFTQSFDLFIFLL